ncbi:unnamed protein product [Rotaria sp. Silwood2]|nr:unnamed protein product [Rotaria sp. Silwood2]
MIGDYVRWPNGIVPYTISSGYSKCLFRYVIIIFEVEIVSPYNITYKVSRLSRLCLFVGAADQNIIINAMRTLENLTAANNVLCVQFRPRVASDGQYYIIIQNGKGCSSYVGRYTGYTLNRTVTLQNSDCLFTGTIMHELIHALGFDHEQSRPDRDDYVRVIWENIIPGMEGNFQKYSISQANTLNTPYDYGSIMHYGRDFFSKNGFDTLVPLKSDVTIGQRDTLSPLDIKAIRTFYGCSVPTSTATTTTTRTSTTTTTKSTTTTSTTTITTTTTTTVTTTTTTTTAITTTTATTTTITITTIQETTVQPSSTRKVPATPCHTKKINVNRRKTTTPKTRRTTIKRFHFYD